MKTKVRIVKHIPARGYPLTLKEYKECHEYATEQEIKKFGLHKFHKLGILIATHPHELLGKSKPSGEIDISMIVPSRPKWEREEVEYHERKEQECIKKKLKNKQKHL